MLDQPAQQARPSAHVVVLGNEKGGSGKSTTALHIAVALLKAGQRVATIDLDGRQKTFTHYIENRRAWARAQVFSSSCGPSAQVVSSICRRITASSAPRAARSKPTRRQRSPTFPSPSARLNVAMTSW